MECSLIAVDPEANLAPHCGGFKARDGRYVVIDIKNIRDLGAFPGGGQASQSRHDIG
jgi:hypothetical protein